MHKTFGVITFIKSTHGLQDTQFYNLNLKKLKNSFYYEMLKRIKNSNYDLHVSVIAIKHNKYKQIIIDNKYR